MKHLGSGYPALTGPRVCTAFCRLRTNSRPRGPPSSPRLPQNSAPSASRSWVHAVRLMIRC